MPAIENRLAVDDPELEAARRSGLRELLRGEGTGSCGIASRTNATVQLENSGVSAAPTVAGVSGTPG
jgi:hypothetical protein